LQVRLPLEGHDLEGKISSGVVLKTSTIEGSRFPSQSDIDFHEVYLHSSFEKLTTLENLTEHSRRRRIDREKRLEIRNRLR
jgi:hypothetical protein